NLIAAFNALENVILPLMFQGVPKAEQNKRAKEILELVGMSARAYHKPSELSGGEQQRVAIARALVNDPEVLLADEPTGNLDSKRGAEIMDFLRKLHEEKKKTIILVTHDSNLAKYAHRIVYIKDGKIVKNI
ncbi:MAG: ATP-binding cassette domain-containing protein, partial [Candidatus Woesearchaeota archaeon]|nr:ATP-binding cassette domain-containing protein [Candidatus Woesearchaeota archaeon]